MAKKSDNYQNVMMNWGAKSLTKSTKKRIIDKIGKCECCGNDEREILVLHHVRRVADGGGNTRSNLASLCPNCHARVHGNNYRTIPIPRKEWGMLKTVFN